MRIVIAAILVLLGLGALIGFLARSSHAAASHPTTTSTPTVTTAPLQPIAGVTGATARFLGLVPALGKPAPDFTLVDQSGGKVTMSGLKGKVVVLTFLDASCTVICPVESAEIRRAISLLGSRSTDVVWLAVDVDGSRASVADVARLARLAGLGSEPTFHALGGSFAALRGVWRSYGVQVEVDQTTGAVLYSPLMLFVDPQGRARYVATPFANQLASGRSVLPASDITRWADALATITGTLARTPSS